MRFKVTGQNKDSGARQTLEFEAESKGAAERKARQGGMSVTRVEDISDGEVAHTGVTPGGSMRTRRKSRGLVGWIVFLLLAAGMFWLFSHGIIRPAHK